MTPAVIGLQLQRAALKLSARLTALEAKLRDDDPLVWQQFAQTAVALASLLRATRPGSGGELLTTEQMAAKLGISSKTLLRRRKAGQVTPALTLGRRGKAAMRWDGSAGLS